MRKARTRRTSISEDPVTAYAEGVVSGRIVAGPHVRDTCARHLRDLADGAKRGLTWDLDKAKDVIAYFPTVLRLAEGQFEGQPLNLEPSQAFIIGSIFGWKRRDGTRRFRRAYIEQGKGNGKSPLAGGVGLYAMASDGEPGAEVYAIAAKMDQARILFRDAVNMVDASPRLSQVVTKSGINPVFNLAHLPTRSFFRPLGRDTGKTGSGYRPHVVLADEVHEHPNRTALEMMERGFKFRRQPLVLMITNSGSDRKSVCWEERSHAVEVAAGLKDDDTTFSYVCALDEGDDPLEDPSCWPKANPLLGVTITEEYLAGVAKQAKDMPGRRNEILRLHFCVWTDAEHAWMARETLERCLDDFDPDEFHGQRVWMGLDLSGTRDLTAIACVVRTGEVEVEAERDGETQRVKKPTYAGWIEAWTPGDTVARREHEDQQPYRVWIDKGYLHAPPGESIRYDHVAQAFAEYGYDFDVQAVAYDRYVYKSRFEPACQQIGLSLPFVEHPQGGVKKGRPTDGMKRVAEAEQREPEGLWMPGSLIELEEAILEGRLRLKRNPVLLSAMMSAVTDKDRWGNRWLAKERSLNKIDPAVALCMAIGAAAGEAGAPQADVFAMIA